MTTKKRDSSQDVLRFILMLMIVILHSVQHGLSVIDNIYTYIIQTLCVVAVNCYFLQSGYFHINYKFEKIVKIFMQCVFSIIIWETVLVAFNKTNLSINYFISNAHKIYAFFNINGFISSYLILFLLSDYINLCINKINKDSFGKLLFVMFLIDTLFGFIGNVSGLSTGHGFFHGVFMYIVGYYISSNADLIKEKISKPKMLVLYFILAFIIAILNMLFKILGFENISLKLLYYNCPLVFIESIFLFLFFVLVNSDIKIPKIISRISSYSVFIILIGDYASAYNIIWYPLIKYAGQLSSLLLLIMTIGNIIVVFCVSVFVGYIFELLFVNRLKGLCNEK